MKEHVSKIFRTFSDFWVAQSKKRKIIYISALGVVFVGAIIFVVALNSKPKEVALYQKLTPSEGAEIVLTIKELGMTATLTSDGSVLVPPGTENDLRMQLSEKGYPKEPVNSDIWNNSVNMFTTDSQQREIKRQQQQSYLKSAIETYEGIDKAYIILNIPEQKDTVINVNAKPSTASVVLHLKENVVLTDKQLSGIKHLMLTGVPGITPEGLTLTDGLGNLLEEGQLPTIDPVTLERNKFKFKQDFENNINQAIVELLLPGYGDGNIKVASTAMLNYDKKLSENTQYIPSEEGDNSGVVAEADLIDGSGTVPPQMNQIIGVDPNADGTYPTGTDAEPGEWAQTESHTKYLVSTLKEQTEKQGYSVEQLSMAVTIFHEANEPDGGQLDAIATMVARAAGTTEELVSVIAIPKFGYDPDTVLQLSPLFGLSKQQLLTFMTVITGLIFILFGVYLVVSAKAKKKRMLIEEQILQAQRAGELKRTEGFFGGEIGPDGQMMSMPMSINEAEEVASESPESMIRREIFELAKNNPEIIAQLLKNWLREEEDVNGKESRSSSGGGR